MLLNYFFRKIECGVSKKAKSKSIYCNLQFTKRKQYKKIS